MRLADMHLRCCYAMFIAAMLTINAEATGLNDVKNVSVTPLVACKPVYLTLDAGHVSQGSGAPDGRGAEAAPGKSYFFWGQ